MADYFGCGQGHRLLISPTGLETGRKTNGRQSGLPAVDILHSQFGDQALRPAPLAVREGKSARVTSGIATIGVMFNSRRI